LVDRSKVEQVLVNLINNAIDAMPVGGSLYVRSYLTKSDKLRSMAKDEGGNALAIEEDAIAVEVEDIGAGMDENVRKKLFDPFFTTKKRAEGTGLGLSVVKNIMDMHKGLIDVESQEGKGSKFTIMLKKFTG